ncbi:MAG: hypothetical protein N3G21_02695 [Candidatus Hydrogenedentes bacterium]|nr:hypothetical protein [Candidatus Hydrogenedentota bacterium]
MEKIIAYIPFIIVLYLVAPLFAYADAKTYFKEAKPVWVKDRSKVMNDFVGFRGVFTVDDTKGLVLTCTGHTSYRVYINGKYLGYGPARGPHGYFRVDEWNLDEFVKKGTNIVAIEVVSYNVNGYGITNQPGFIQAEVRKDGEVLCATGDGEKKFIAFDLDYKLKKVERYSFQRGFTEAYRLGQKSFAWKFQLENSPSPCDIEVFPSVNIIPRRVPIPNFEILIPTHVVREGIVDLNKPVKNPWRNRDVAPRQDYLAYPFEELEYSPVLDFQSITIDEKGREVNTKLSLPIDLNKASYKVFDFNKSLTGFICVKLYVNSPTKLFFTFDEIMRDGKVDWKRLGCHNVVSVEFLESGEYEFETIEPYTFRFLQLVSTTGNVRVESIGIRLYENPDSQRAKFNSSNEIINNIFEAGRATFAQNAVDIFMDCPHRERAGWLCDSFFTARAGMVLCGNLSVEKNFIENFLLPEKFEFLPEGMLPMCYPSDHNNGVFIPNWAMWFVIQLGEYAERSNDWDLVNALKPRVLNLVKFFEGYRNEDGLLEKLPSWVFVEWSKANDFVQDVNYPSNMLYAGVLETVAKLYNLPEYKEEADKIKETIRKQSFDGKFFVDNAVRKNGKLKVTSNKTEVCQYFAFFFKIATPETYPDLWKIIQQDFGPHRKDNNKFPEVHLANSFIGNVLRAELLTLYGNPQQVLDESIGYLDYMAKETGTLWENVHDRASLNHGFASHIVYIYYRTGLGIKELDPVNKKAKVVFQPISFSYCEGEIPINNEWIKLSWKQDKDKILYRMSFPSDWSVSVENLTGKKLIEEK